MLCSVLFSGYWMAIFCAKVQCWWRLDSLNKEQEPVGYFCLCALPNNGEENFPLLKWNMFQILLHTPFTWSSVSWGCSHNDCPPCVTQNSFLDAGAPVLDERSKTRNMILSITSFHQYLFQNTTVSLMEWSYLVLLRYKGKINQPWLTLYLRPCLDRGQLNKTSVRRKGCGLRWLILSHKYKSVRVVPHHMYQTLLSLSRAGSPHPSPEEAGHPLLTLHLGDRRFCMSSKPTEKKPQTYHCSSNT